MTINLTDLAAARAKMTPGDMAHRQIRDDGDLIFDGVYAGDGNSVAYDEVGDDAGWDPHNAAGIVAEHNAIGVLIEVARTVIDRDSAQAAYDEAKLSGDRDAFGSARDRLEASRAKYRAALAKVSL